MKQQCVKREIFSEIINFFDELDIFRHTFVDVSMHGFVLHVCCYREALVFPKQCYFVCFEERCSVASWLT